MVAERGNDMGTAGLIGNAQNTCLLVARVFPDSGDVAQSSAIEAAVEWCADRGAKVINMSLGGLSPTENGRMLYETIRNEGRLVVAAAGNGNSNDLIYPASFSSVISVGAVDRQLQRASFSQFNEQLDVCAPGVDVFSTVPSAVIRDNLDREFPLDLLEYSPIPTSMQSMQGDLVDCGLGVDKCQAEGKICVMERGRITFREKAVACEQWGGIALIVYNNDFGRVFGTLTESHSVTIPAMGLTEGDGKYLLAAAKSVSLNFLEGGYARLSGTSMAAPYVSAAAAMVWAARPSCSNDQVQEALEETAMDLGSRGRDDQFGHGLVQASQAYEYLLGLDPPCGLAPGEDENDISDVDAVWPPKKAAMDDFLPKDDSQKLYTGDNEDRARGGLNRRKERRERRALKGNKQNTQAL